MRFLTICWSSIRRIPWGVSLAALLLLAPASAWSAYKLQPGDILDISITGAPDFKHRSPIGLEGDVSIPLVGQMEVRGLTVAEAREKIIRSLSNKIYHQRTLDGMEVPQRIVPDTIIVTVADYRPVYLNGDVSKPGEQPFRPGITVRHAVAVAGGYDALQMRGQYQGGRPEIWVYRKTETGTQNVVASEDMELSPGDVVNITMQTENLALGQ